MTKSVKSVKWTAPNGAELEAIITVIKSIEEIKAVDWGFTVATEVYTDLSIEIMVNGKLHSSSNQLPTVIETSTYADATKADMKAKGAYAYVTETAAVQEEQYNLIAIAIGEATSEVNAKFTAENEEIVEEVELEERIDAEVIKMSLEVVEMAAKQSEILPEAEEKKWKIAYNNLHNEGGDGYVPERITQEELAAAKKALR